MTRKSWRRRDRDVKVRAASFTSKVEKALGKEMLLGLVGYLVEQLGGEIRVDVRELAKPRDLGMAKDGRLLVAVWQGNFQDQLREVQENQPLDVVIAGTPIESVEP